MPEAPRWFTEDEVRGLDRGLVSMLDRARGLAKIPFVITSGVRDPDHNDLVGGVEDSAHIHGLAVDIACTTSRNRFRMVSAAYLAGFRRIGCYPRHLHLDVDRGKPLDVLWVPKS